MQMMQWVNYAHIISAEGFHFETNLTQATYPRTSPPEGHERACAGAYAGTAEAPKGQREGS
jgi:hypothetical protein